MMAQAKVRWVENLMFAATSPSGHTISIDGDEPMGTDQAVHPGELLLLALGGCTGMDVISLLRKMRQEVDSFEVLLDGEQREEHPKAWTKMVLKYVVTGRNIEEAKLEKAINLSHERYCQAVATLKQSVDIEFSWEIRQRGE